MRKCPITVHSHSGRQALIEGRDQILFCNIKLTLNKVLERSANFRLIYNMLHSNSLYNSPDFLNVIEVGRNVGKMRGSLTPRVHLVTTPFIDNLRSSR